MTPPRGAEYPEPIRDLIAALRRMPGIGPRSAERIALWLLSNPDARPSEIAAAIAGAANLVKTCRSCGFFTTADLCAICADPARRAAGTLCVVEQPTDIPPLERTGLHRGLYHALGGRIAPLDHVGPNQLRIAPLLARVADEKPHEIILALSADVEGEATAHYLADLLRDRVEQITRIAQGIPAGLGLESADQVTLGRALSGRVQFGG